MQNLLPVAASKSDSTTQTSRMIAGLFAFANALGNAFYFYGYYYFWRTRGARLIYLA